MPTLGADPDRVTEPWNEYALPPQRMRMRPTVAEMVNYFSYHPQMKMAQRNDDTDKAVLARYFARKIDSGVTVPSLKKMVDRFYQSWAADAALPALTFVSKKVQDSLSEFEELDSKDPVVNWLLDGMPDVGPFADPKGVRKEVLLSSGDLAQRFPDLLVAVLSTDLSPGLMGQGMEMLDNLVKWNMGEDVEHPSEREITYWQQLIKIPAVLLTGRRSPKAIPLPKGSMQRAISAARKTKVDWMLQ